MLGIRQRDSWLATITPRYGWHREDHSGDADDSPRHVPIVPLVPEQFLDTATWARIDRKARAWGYERLGRLAAIARKRGLRVTTVLCEGDPSRHIVVTARGVRASFVVMGTHGRRGRFPAFSWTVSPSASSRWRRALS